MMAASMGLHGAESLGHLIGAIQSRNAMDKVLSQQAAQNSQYQAQRQGALAAALDSLGGLGGKKAVAQSAQKRRGRAKAQINSANLLQRSGGNGGGGERAAAIRRHMGHVRQVAGAQADLAGYGDMLAGQRQHLTDLSQQLNLLDIAQAGQLNMMPLQMQVAQDRGNLARMWGNLAGYAGQGLGQAGGYQDAARMMARLF